MGKNKLPEVLEGFRQIKFTEILEIIQLTRQKL